MCRRGRQSVHRMLTPHLGPMCLHRTSSASCHQRTLGQFPRSPFLTGSSPELLLRVQTSSCLRIFPSREQHPVAPPPEEMRRLDESIWGVLGGDLQLIGNDGSSSRLFGRRLTGSPAFGGWPSCVAHPQPAPPPDNTTRQRSLRDRRADNPWEQSRSWEWHLSHLLGPGQSLLC